MTKAPTVSRRGLRPQCSNLGEEIDKRREHCSRWRQRCMGLVIHGAGIALWLGFAGLLISDMWRQR